MQIRRPPQRPDPLVDYYDGEYSHISQILALKENDYERYLYCRQRAEQCREEWFEKERLHIVRTLHAYNPQFRDMTPKRRVVHAKIRWQTSEEAKEIMSDEQMWTRWAQMYQESIMLQRLELIHAQLESLNATFNGRTSSILLDGTN